MPCCNIINFDYIDFQEIRIFVTYLWSVVYISKLGKTIMLLSTHNIHIFFKPQLALSSKKKKTAAQDEPLKKPFFSLHIMYVTLIQYVMCPLKGIHI